MLRNVPLVDPWSTRAQLPSGWRISTACRWDTPTSSSVPDRSISGLMPSRRAAPPDADVVSDERDATGVRRSRGTPCPRVDHLVVLEIRPGDHLPELLLPHGDAVGRAQGVPAVAAAGTSLGRRPAVGTEAGRGGPFWAPAGRPRVRGGPSLRLPVPDHPPSGPGAEARSRTCCSSPLSPRHGRRGRCGVTGPSVPCGPTWTRRSSRRPPPPWPWASPVPWPGPRCRRASTDGPGPRSCRSRGPVCTARP